MALSLYRTSLDLYRQALSVRPTRCAAPHTSPPPIVPAYPATDSATSLTAREWEVARLIARGCTNQQIAQELVVTRGTAANHVAHILTKLELSNRTQVAAYLVGSLVAGRSESPVPDAWVEHAVRKVG